MSELSVLSLVTTEDLIEELYNRHYGFIYSLMRVEDGGRKVVDTGWNNKDASFLEMLGMAHVLISDMDLARMDQAMERADDDEKDF